MIVSIVFIGVLSFKLIIEAMLSYNLSTVFLFTLPIQIKNVRNSINHLTMKTPNILFFGQIHCHKSDYFA